MRGEKMKSVLIRIRLIRILSLSCKKILEM